MNKTLALPPRGTMRIMGTLRPQANVIGISEQIGARWAHRRVDMSRHYTIPIPNYGKIVKGNMYKSCRHVKPGQWKDPASMHNTPVPATAPGYYA